jgi:hypothetical protein
MLPLKRNIVKWLMQNNCTFVISFFGTLDGHGSARAAVRVFLASECFAPLGKRTRGLGDLFFRHHYYFDSLAV